MNNVISSIHQTSFNTLYMYPLNATVRQHLSVSIMTKADGRC